MPPYVSAETMTFKTEQLSFLKESFLCTEASPLGKILMKKPRLIQGIRSGDGVGDLFNYLFIKDIKSNRMRIAQ